MRFTTSSEDHQNPAWISPEEMASPGDFVRNFCESWKLSDCRFYLWQMLSNSVSYEFTHVEASVGGQIFFFENVMAMIESVYLLNTHISECGSEENLGPDPARNPQERRQNPETDLLDKIVSIIRKTAPAEKIFLISPTLEHSTASKFDFIVLIDSADPKSAGDYETEIKNLTESVASVQISIFKISYFNLIVENGGYIYFSTVLQNGELVFDSGKHKDFTIPISQTFDRAQLRFEYFYKRAVAFQKAAEAHFKRKEYELAAFSCHQAIEHALNALLFSLMGVKNKTHNLTRLLTLAARIVPELLPGFFIDDNQNDLLPVLQSAYIKARYSEKFAIDPGHASFMMSKADLLIALVTNAVEKIKNNYRPSETSFDTSSLKEKDHSVTNEQVSTTDEVHEAHHPFLKSFFDCYAPDDFKKPLFLILQAYSQNDYYRQSSPADVLFAMEKLGELIYAANELHSGHLTIAPREDHNTVIKSELTESFTLGELSISEKQNPHQVIAEFFSFKTYEQWDECLEHISFFALCSDDPAEAGYKEDTLTIFEKVCKLVGACHRIYTGQNN
jgi:HEPN domain-containing protein